LILFGGFRATVGVDTFNYSKLFNSIMPFNANFQNSINSLNTELGFLYLIGLLKTIGFLQVQSLFSVVIIFNYCIYFFSIKKLTPNFELALLFFIVFYFFVRDMGVIRQAIATAITFLSIVSIYEKKIFKFILLILFASLFHISALVFFPAYFIGQINFSKGKLLFFVFIGLFLSFIPTEIKNKAFFSLTSTDLPFFNNPEFGNPLPFLSLTLIRRVFPAILVFIFYDKIIANVKNSGTVISLYIFGLTFSIFFIDIGIYVTRLFIYYLILDVVIYSYLFSIFKFKSMKNSYGLMLLFICIFFILNYMGSPPWLMTPYDNIIFNWA
jgi:hypothetical protein